MKSLIAFLFIIVLGSMLFINCSSVKKDRDSEVRAFIDEFANSLSESDLEILSYFSSGQRQEALLSGIRVLQNVDIKYVKCKAAFDNPTITYENDGVKVIIPIQLAVDSVSDRRVDDDLILWLAKKPKGFSIVKFEAESFYNNYISLRNEVELQMNQGDFLSSRLPYFNKAREIQQKYDSVIWFTNYNGKIYFYAVKGLWINYFLDNREEGRPQNVSMALVDENGKEIVPLGYDLIGTPGIAMSDVVEVRKNNLFGYYQVSTGKNIVPAEYKWIIPPSDASKFILVKKDSLYGWLDKELSFHPGFPNAETERYVMNFEFLPVDYRIDETNQAMAEIPNADQWGSGIVMAPSYLTSFGLFEEILGGFQIKSSADNSEEHNYRGYRDYSKSNYDFLGAITNQISSLISTVTTRYVEGREEFYTHKEIAFLNAQNEYITSVGFYEIGQVSFRKIDSTLLEVKITPSKDDIQGWGEPPEGEYNLPEYKYFIIDNAANSVALSESNRKFDFTEKVKMDSSYLIGNFVRYDTVVGKDVEGNFLIDSTIKGIRNEILASYGYRFSDANTLQSFSYNKWYDPKYSSYSEFFNIMTDIDKHNLIFLERIVGTLDPSYSASL